MRTQTPILAIGEMDYDNRPPSTALKFAILSICHGGIISSFTSSIWFYPLYSGSIAAKESAHVVSANVTRDINQNYTRVSLFNMVGRLNCSFSDVFVCGSCVFLIHI
jgi:hypothetical protein